jgi:hypothetical protein
MVRIRRFAEQAASEAGCAADRFKRLGRQLLRDQSDTGARLPKIADYVVAIDQHFTVRRVYDSANDINQRRLAGTVRSEQAEYLARVDLKIDIR